MSYSFESHRTFWTSDIHVGHGLMITKLRRPFDSRDAMDAGIIYRWNQKIPKNADVFILGDVSFRKLAETVLFLQQLNGRKYLIPGNHDRKLLKKPEFRECFEAVSEDRIHDIRIEGIRIVMSHFPLESWENMSHGAWHLHGHSHGYMRPFGKRYDVGMDPNNCTPVSFGELKRIMDQRPINSREHYRGPIRHALERLAPKLFAPPPGAAKPGLRGAEA